MPAPTADILFPEILADDLSRVYPEIDGYDASPTPATSVVEFDNGAEQKRRRHAFLMSFRYRSAPMYGAGNDWRDFYDFIDEVGTGDVNFGFYEPYARFYGQVVVGVSDGDETVLTNFRGLDSYSSVLVDGSPVTPLTLTPETGDLKRDEFTFDAAIPAGQLVEITNGYGRRLYICRMVSVRRYPYRGGAVEAYTFQPGYPTVPVFREQFDLRFVEIGG